MGEFNVTLFKIDFHERRHEAVMSCMLLLNMKLFNNDKYSSDISLDLGVFKSFMQCIRRHFDPR